MKTETVEEYLKRGGKIERIETVVESTVAGKVIKNMRTYYGINETHWDAKSVKHRHNRKRRK